MQIKRADNLNCCIKIVTNDPCKHSPPCISSDLQTMEHATCQLVFVPCKLQLPPETRTEPCCAPANGRMAKQLGAFTELAASTRLHY